MNIYFISAEVEPFAKSGGLGDVAGALPKCYAEKGHDVRVIMPYYSIVEKKYGDKMSEVASFEAWLGWRRQKCRLLCLNENGVSFYFVDSPFYYGGERIYDENDLERFAFFSKVALDAVDYMDFKPDIVHCNDWSTALVPVMLDCFYRRTKTYAKTKTVFTIHNIKYQGIYDISDVIDKTGLHGDYMMLDKLEFYGKCNLMKGAIVFSNAVTTVSEKYAEEIKTSDFGEGLQDVIKQNEGKIIGITNGVDYSVYSPETDSLIYKNYGAKDFAEGKAYNKAKLFEELGFDGVEYPFVTMVSRLYEQKGPDLILGALEDIMRKDVRIAILGSGDAEIERAFREMAERYPEKLKVFIGFDNALAHKLYAASDLFLMPSRFEPCGLSQLIAMKYGSIPVVRATGGLFDTVKKLKEDTTLGKGFIFKQPFSFDFRTALYDGMKMYSDKREDFDRLVEWDMSRDYSWASGAEKYLRLYEQLLAAE